MTSDIGSLDLDTSLNRAPLLRDQVYEVLRKGILSGDLPARQRLVEEQLADQLGVSRTPIREAIQRLHVEGLVVSSSSGRTEVAQVSRAGIEENLDIRQLLETYACRLAARRISEARLATLREIHQQEVACLEGECDEGRMSELNSALHRELLLASQNQTLVHLVNHLYAREPAYRLFPLGSPENLKRFSASHGRIIAALAVGDEAGAEEEMFEHIELAKQVLSEKSSQDPLS